MKRIIAWGLERKPVRAYFLYLDAQGPKLADSVTYRALFALFAGVLLGFSVAGIWFAGNEQAMQALVDTVDAIIPGLIGEDGAIDPADLVQPIAFSIAGIVALVGLLGTAMGAVGSLAFAFRHIAGQPNDQTFFIWAMARNLALAIGFGLLLAVGAVLTVGGTALLGAVLDWLGVSERSWVADAGVRALSTLVALLIDTAVIIVMFRILSGLRPRARSIWPGALLGGLALTVLQVLSGLFIGGASANPLLASFAALVALLLWLNLSTQVILLAAAYIVTGVDEEQDRIAARYGAPTLAVRRLQGAERRAQAAAAEVTAAREAADAERGA